LAKCLPGSSPLPSMCGHDIEKYRTIGKIMGSACPRQTRGTLALAFLALPPPRSPLSVPATLPLPKSFHTPTIPTRAHQTITQQLPNSSIWLGPASAVNPGPQIKQKPGPASAVSPRQQTTHQPGPASAVPPGQQTTHQPGPASAVPPEHANHATHATHSTETPTRNAPITC
jgi:hypothetical protein